MVHFFFLSFLPSFLPFFLAFFVSFCSGSVSHVWKNMSPQQKADHSPELPPLGVFFRNMLVKVYWLSTWFGVFVFYFAYIYLLMHTRETYVPTQPLQICQHAMNGKLCTQLFQSIQTIVSAPQRDCCIFKLSSSSGVDSQNFECSTVAWDVS